MSTTTYIKDEIKHSVSVLNGLIETCKDGEQGFAAAAKKAKDSALATLFAKYAAQRAGFAAELQFAVTELGSDAAESGHIAATLHRGWISLKEAVSGDSDKALIDECEAGEDAAMKNYQEAATDALPIKIKDLIGKQFVGIRDAHSVIRDLKHGVA